MKSSRIKSEGTSKQMEQHTQKYRAREQQVMRNKQGANFEWVNGDRQELDTTRVLNSTPDNLLQCYPEDFIQDGWRWNSEPTGSDLYPRNCAHGREEDGWMSCKNRSTETNSSLCYRKASVSFCCTDCDHWNADLSTFYKTRRGQIFRYQTFSRFGLVRKEMKWLI